MFPELLDYCDTEDFNAECSAGKVILVQEARYGIMGLGTCLKRDFGVTDCYRFVVLGKVGPDVKNTKLKTIMTLGTRLQSTKFVYRNLIGFVYVRKLPLKLKQARQIFRAVYTHIRAVYAHIFSDVLNVMDKWCSGKRECRMEIHFFMREGITNSCPYELRSYLQARYICLPGEYFSQYQ